MTATLPPGALARRTLVALATFTVNSTGDTSEFSEAERVVPPGIGVVHDRSGDQ